MAGTKEKTTGAVDKAKGKVKEVAGRVTKDRSLEAEGKRTRPRVA